MRSFLCVSCAVVGLLINCNQNSFAQAGEGVPLRSELKIGKTYRFDTSTAIRMKLANRADQSSEIILAQRVRLIVNRRPSGGEGVFITASTEHIRFKLAAEGNEMTFDSSDPKAMESPVGKHFKKSLARWTQIELSPEGKLIRRQDSGGGLGEQTAEPDSLAHLPEIGPDELQQFVAELLSNLPSDPVRIGEKWIQKSETSFGQFGAMNFEIANHYASNELLDGSTCAAIKFTGSVKGDVKVVDEDGSEAGGNTLGFGGTTMTGQFFHDLDHGITRSREQIMVMQIKNPQLPDATVEQHIETQLVSIEDNSK